MTSFMDDDVSSHFLRQTIEHQKLVPNGTRDTE
jgi:hypothetical protein